MTAVYFITLLERVLNTLNIATSLSEGIRISFTNQLDENLMSSLSNI